MHVCILQRAYSFNSPIDRITPTVLAVHKNSTSSSSSSSSSFSPPSPPSFSVSHYQSTRSLPSFIHHLHSFSSHTPSFSTAQAGFVQFSRPISLRTTTQREAHPSFNPSEHHPLHQDEAQLRHYPPTSSLRLRLLWLSSPPSW